MSSKKNERLKKLILASLDELKAKNINVLSVAGISSITDWMIIANGTSSRHVKALANNVELNAKKNDYLIIGVEGYDIAEWVLIDFGDVVVHVMLPETRSFYDLEGIWTINSN
jgi:ribosome-associated protein